MLIGIVLFVWASAFVAIRHGLEIFSAGNLAFLRYLTASVAFIVVAIIKKIKLPDVKDIPGCIFLGLLGFTLYNLLLNYGERTVDAGLASFIINTSPFISLLIVVFRKEEKISTQDCIGFIIAFSGVGIIIFSKNKTVSLNADALLILGAAISQAVYFVLQKKFLKKYTPLQITSYAVWCGTTILFFFADKPFAAIANADPNHIFSIIYLGIFPGTIAYLIVAFALAKYKMGNFASYFFLIPFIALGISFLLLNETPSLIGLLGGLLIILGILIKNKMIRIKSKRKDHLAEQGDAVEGCDATKA